MEDTSLNKEKEQMSEHVKQLEEIDREQREKEHGEPSAETSAFANSVVEALHPDKKHLDTPLLSQEEIEDEEPPRINLTAVICTAIVAVCATIVLCVAHPWRSDEEMTQVQTVQPTEPTDQAKNEQSAVKESKPEATQPVKKVETQQEAKETTKVEPVGPAAKEPTKKEEEKKPVSTLPVVKSTKTGTPNPYNDIRLIDASSRLLTQAEVAQMSKAELALARNAIYARHGYQFNNAELNEFFGKQAWFKPSDVKIEAIPFTQIELDNIRLIKAREQSLK